MAPPDPVLLGDGSEVFNLFKHLQHVVTWYLVRNPLTCLQFAQLDFFDILPFATRVFPLVNEPQLDSTAPLISFADDHGPHDFPTCLRAS